MLHSEGIEELVTGLCLLLLQKLNRLSRECNQILPLSDILTHHAVLRSIRMCLTFKHQPSLPPTARRSSSGFAESVAMDLPLLLTPRLALVVVTS